MVLWCPEPCAEFLRTKDAEFRTKVGLEARLEYATELAPEVDKFLKKRYNDLPMVKYSNNLGQFIF